MSKTSEHGRYVALMPRNGVRSVASVRGRVGTAGCVWVPTIDPARREHRI